MPQSGGAILLAGVASLALAAGFLPADASAVALASTPPTDAARTHAEAPPPTDLDAFMGDVLAHRDANWKKLQQYVLDERETIDLRGPGNVPLWGERRDYTWYLRDGFFVRSPLRVNGVAIAEADRVKYERDYLRSVQERDKRRVRGQDAPAAPPPEAPVASAADPANMDALIKQSREPAFISSAYFLRFKFEPGHYALVGRESVDGRDVLRIEYYPEKLFGGTDRRRSGKPASDADHAHDREFQRLMNKVALVTLWVEPASHQIVKYTFDNVAFDFLPAQWLVHIDDLHASMTMGQPFPDVWLPHALDLAASITLAVGQFDGRYALEYHDYRRADVSVKVGIKER
jgi:hypothetical protein